MPEKHDFNIVMELMNNSRSPFSNIAKKLNISPGTVNNRFNKMCESGVIEACSANVDLSKFGYQCKIFLLMKISKKENKNVIIDKVSKIQNVLATSGVIGDFDIFVVAIAKDLVGLDKTVKQIRSVGIEQIEMGLSIRDTTPLLPDKPV
jgi:Lrp/AsnC family transcriptional regulator for asnA, asnC and gidA